MTKRMRLVPKNSPILISALGVLISHLWSLRARRRLATKLREELGGSSRDAGTPQTAIIVLGFLRQSTKPHSPTEALSLRIQTAATEWRKRCRREAECVIIASGGDPQRLGRTEAQDVKASRQR
ncbi:hypothetical protein CYMTET_12147 [Cymbomonas tetramitiformis]|uniref:Uncharacterized protein n=1 Tax=Cymbomonas tetramitiformis TaxID=36881 RepID=A0AAE0GKN1_9CHLO|nr:hypothetical protein CYMTET_12147 [Cymbomonas tetramitiformis]